MITLLNIIRVIYSFFVLRKYNDLLDSDIIEKIIETHKTCDLKIYEMCIGINYLKALGHCKDGSKEQMLRELIYHKKLYRLGLFRSHTDGCDFETIQTYKTYIRRIIGNCILV